MLFSKNGLIQKGHNMEFMMHPTADGIEVSFAMYGWDLSSVSHDGEDC